MIRIRGHVVGAFLCVFSALVVQHTQAQCSSTACLETAQTLLLPQGPLSQQTTPALKVELASNTTSLIKFTATFSGLPTGYAIANGTYLAWCFDLHGLFGNNTATTQYYPYSSYASNLPANTQSPNWDKVNWVLNHKPAVTQSSWVVQQVIWRLINGSYLIATGYPLPQPDSDNLYNAALAQGAGFVPAAGQTVGVILYVDGLGTPPPSGSNTYQDLVMEVPMPNCGRLGDFVWNDLNGNGVQDAGEPGIDGVTVKLLDTYNNVLATTVTTTFNGQKGYYQFTNLSCQTQYYVQVDTSSPPLSGMIPSPTGGTPDTALDSNPNPASVVIPPSGSDQTIDFGFYNPANCTGSIGDFVWYDANKNGIQDVDEMGIPNVSLSLTGPNGLALTTTTDGNGHYLFGRLCAGAYTVAVTPPANYTPTTPNAPGSTPDNDSNPSPSAVVLSTANPNDLTVDFGFYPTCNSSIGDFVWIDLNGNGVQDPNEQGLNNVTVGLFDSTGTTLLTSTITQQVNGVNGSYSFTGLCSGTYVVKVTDGVPQNYTPSPTGQGTPSTDSNGSPTTVVLPPNTNDTTVDFGYVPPCTGTIGDFVWTDTNANGVQDAGELGIPSVTLILHKASDNSVLGTTHTDGNGYYLFTGVCTGNYRVEVVPPANMYPSPTGQGTPDKDSNPNPAPVSLPQNNSNDLTIDFGFFPAPSATCLVIDAVQGNSFSVGPMAGSGGAGGPYTFSLVSGPSWLNVSPNGVVSGTPTATGSFSYTVQVADKDGNKGTLDCSVTVKPPPSATCLAINAVQGNAFSAGPMVGFGGNGGPYTFLLVSGPSWLNVSSTGVVSGTPTASGSFSYTVQVTDKDGNKGTLNCSVPVQPPTPNIGITKTADVSSVAPGKPVVYTYVVTNTGTAPLTNVTVLDDNATPAYTSDDILLGPIASLAAGQSVTLTATRIPPAQQCMTINSTPTVVGTLITQTLANGNIQVTYRQSRNVVDNVYGTSATAATGWPNGHKFSDFTGSDEAQFRFTDGTGKIVLEFKADYLSTASTATYPSGYGTLGATGGDGGIVTGSASNILSVSTSMTTNLNKSPFLGMTGITTNSPVEPTAGWDYVDSYTVVISSAAFGVAGFGNVSIVGVHNSPSKLGFNLVVPTPCTADAINTAVVTGYYGSIQLTASDKARVTVTGGGGSVTGSLGDLVWYDYNANGIQDAGETGIAGAMVTLSGAATDTTTTDVNGNYLFYGLLAGNYTVCVTPASLPSGLVQTYDLDGVGTPNCANVTLTTGQNRSDVDFGYRPPPPLGLTKTAGTTSADIGEEVTYTYTVVNTGTTALTNVTIMDDNGSPDNAADDFAVGAPIASLPPNTPITFTATTVPPAPMCMLVNNVSKPVGTLTVTQLANGDFQVVYRQSTSLVDNTYGTTASADWPNGHKFGDFTGSDKAEFRFTNGKGDVVLDFFADYLTASTKFPSGYGSLGVTGGDGKMVIGSASNIVSITTSMTTNLNQSPAYYGYIINSPAPPNANWDYVDSYTVVVKAAAFGDSGFGSVSVPSVHNSPSKLGFNEALPEACSTGVTNIATATAMNGTTPVQVTATATVLVGVAGSTAGPYTTYVQGQFGDPKQAAAKLLVANFPTLYPSGIKIGGGFTATFTSASAVIAYLPSGGGPQKFNKNYVNPSTTNAGELASQALTLQINVDFSLAGILKSGLADLTVKTGKLAGYSVNEVRQLANQVLGGGTLPPGVGLADLKDTLKHINEDYQGGTNDRGYLY